VTVGATGACDPAAVLTVGHSTRPLEQFVALLIAAQVTRVVDVRAIPRSRRHPQFDGDQLTLGLAERGIDYHHLPELGGRRGRAAGVAPDVNGFWSNVGFHNYADYALSDEFQAGLDRLLTLARERRSAILCAEAVWWRCHRRIIADYLLDRGTPVFHLMEAGRIQPARQTPAAQRSGPTRQPSRSRGTAVRFQSGVAPAHVAR
jgi:uncharacterized protein (DUF488 family)